MKCFAHYHKPLAYFLYQNYHFSYYTKANYLSTYLKLTNGGKNFDLNNIRMRLLQLDKDKRQNKELSEREWKRMVEIARTATGDEIIDIPKTIFTCETQELNTQNIIKKRNVEDIISKLECREKFKEA